MTIAELVPLVVKGSIISTVLALGLNTSWQEVGYLWRNPSLLLRSLFSMNVLMPLVASILVLAFRPPQVVIVMLVALSLAPTPPILPKKTGKAGGSASYGVSLMATSGLLAIITVPLLVELVQRAFGIPLHVPSIAVAKLVFMLAIIPLAIGMLVRHFAPDMAALASTWIGRIASVLLLLVALVLLATAWRPMLDLITGGAVVPIVLFSLIGLLLGHLLGGPESSNRTVLALATAGRHPGIAMAIASLNFPDMKGVLPMVLLFLIVSAVCTAPYIAWRKKRGAAETVGI